MTCQEAERMITPYLKDELTGDELEGFLNHLEECKSCQEELEIYFMVDLGVKQLDSDNEKIDIVKDLEQKIEESYSKVTRMWFFRIFRYAVNTLMVMAVIVMILLQFRIWLL